MKLHKFWHSESSWVGTSVDYVRVFCSLGHEYSSHLHSFFALHVSSISLFLSFLLYINLRTVSTGFPEFSPWFDWVIEYGGGVMETPTFNYLVRCMWTSWLEIVLRSQESLDISTCGIGTDSTDTVSEVNRQWGAHLVLGIGCDWCRNHIFAVRKNPRLTLPYDLRAYMGLGEVSSESRTLHSETLIIYLYFQAPSRINSVSMGCDLTVSCPDPTTQMLVLWGKSFVASSSEQGKFLTWVLWMMMNHEYKQLIPIS